MSLLEKDDDWRFAGRNLGADGTTHAAAETSSARLKSSGAGVLQALKALESIDWSCLSTGGAMTKARPGGREETETESRGAGKAASNAVAGGSTVFR